MQSVSEPVCCSAPGKVLLTGGYLILQREYSGLVLTTSARFFSSVRSLQGKEPRIVVHSPQFHAVIEFELVFGPEVAVIHKSGTANPFIENALLLSLNAALLSVGDDRVRLLCSSGLQVVIQGDNSFYSQDTQLSQRSLPATVSSLRQLPRFAPLDSGPLRKTGLGSSAALTTSLTAALLVYLGAVDCAQLGASGGADSRSGRALVHNVSQAAHCAAQGKLGSGFDVSAAAFGSQQYRRFSPSILQPLLSALSSESIGAALGDLLGAEAGWDSEVRPLSLPDGFRLLLGDVGRGSNTPNMVSKVLRWRDAASADSVRVITQLGRFNQEVAEGISSLKRPTASESERSAQLQAVRTSFVEVRRLLREMGTLAEVDIEPPTQQELCDATMALPGVLFCGVPGAGGYDAICAVAVDDDAAARVQALWESRSVLLLDLAEDHEGVRLESPDEHFSTSTLAVS
eukprot:TRINITY_DN30914_c0_g1_i1.p1 TRINITY_DN30914_c0_g1~~TRINITY_DN30914_c0_g1_i1.p1  ORF type:complete len:521 (-),score=114.11 TRINITY_DN30914_c0_g1_i1:1227-2600(-)